MIDYDDLRKLAEAIMPDEDGNYDYDDLFLRGEIPNEIADYIEALPPKITLRLLRIIVVAKTAIKEANERIRYNNTHRQRYEDRNDEQTIAAIDYLLDDAAVEIAKLEKE